MSKGVSGDVIGYGEKNKRVEDSLELGALLAGEKGIVDFGSHNATEMRRWIS